MILIEAPMILLEALVTRGLKSTVAIAFRSNTDWIMADCVISNRVMADCTNSDGMGVK